MSKPTPASPHIHQRFSQTEWITFSTDSATSVSFQLPTGEADNENFVSWPQSLLRVDEHEECIPAGQWLPPPAGPRNLCRRKGAVSWPPRPLDVQSPFGPSSAPIALRRECWPRSRLTTAGFHGRRPADCACFLFFPRSVGFGPTDSRASGAFTIAPSMLCHDQEIPSRSSYSASPKRHIARKTPCRFQAKKYLWTELALPNSLGNAFHWQPVRRTYMMASKVLRGSIGFLPPPGRRLYWCPSSRFLIGISGATRFHNSSEIVHDLIAPMSRIIKEWRYKVNYYLRISS